MSNPVPHTYIGPNNPTWTIGNIVQIFSTQDENLLTFLSSLLTWLQKIYLNTPYLVIEISLPYGRPTGFVSSNW
jgi:hypothetical protein